MRYEYIEPFVASTIKVLDNVIMSDIARGDISLVSNEKVIGDIAIMIRLGGDSEGSIILNMPTDTALKICNVMFGDNFDTLTPLGMDSIAELANMIAGNAISVINDLGYDFQVYPPAVFVENYIRESAPGLEVFQIPLFTDYGEITMNVSLRTN